MAGEINHSCRCGATQTSLSVPAKAAGTHLRCYCGDCQTAACLNDKDQDILLPTGASVIWHTTPDRLTIRAGAENLKVFRLSPRGGYRWYAGCCGSLMFSTLKNLKIPFLSVPLRVEEHARHSKLMGPVRCHAFTESARPHPDSPGQPSGVNAAGARIVFRALACWLSGRARSSPLMAGDGGPIAPVEVITLGARKAARPDHLK